MKNLPRQLLLIIILMVSIVALSQEAHSATWQQTNGPFSPFGSSIYSLAINPTTPQTLYAGTYFGGVFKSTDGGTTWSEVNSGLTDTHVICLVIDPTTPQTLYAGTESGGVFKSTDGGATWSAVNRGLTDQNIRSLAINPSTPQTLYTGTYLGGVFKSTDSGANWSAVTSGPKNVTINSLAIDPITPQTLYAGTWGGGVFKSTDGGATWSAVNSGLTNAFIQSLTIDPTTPQTLYTGTSGGGVFKSTDGGATWITSGLTNMDIVSLAIYPTTPQALYAGTRGGGVFKSTDGGATWSGVTSGLTNLYIFSLAIDPTTPQTLYVGTWGGGVFKSIDGGAIWSEANSGLTKTTIKSLAIDPTTPQTLYAGTYGGGGFKSIDGGTTWSGVNNGLTNTKIQSLVIDPITPQTLYAGTYGDGVFKSTDGGATWSAATSGLTKATINSLAIDPTTPQTLYAGTYSNGVFKSTDGGTTWGGVINGLTSFDIQSLVINPTTPLTLYVGTWSGGIFKSTDGGTLWSGVTSGLTNTIIQSLAIDPTTPQTLYAGTWGGGIFKSTDGGTLWSEVNSGLTNTNIQSLAINPTTPQTLYAGTYGGVFKSTNGGTTWSEVNSGLTDLYIQSLAINPTTPQTLYAGTYGGSVFKITFPAPVIGITPASGSYNQLHVGTPDTPITYTISNTSPDLLTFSSAPFITGTNPGDFIISNSSCGATIGARAFCSLDVTFTPQAGGSRSATLTVLSDATNTPILNIPLSGSGGYTLTIPDPGALGYIDGGICGDGCELRCGTNNGSNYTQCSGMFSSGMTLNFTQTPAAGSLFTGWSGTGVTCSGSGPCSVTMPEADLILNAGYCGSASGTFGLAPPFSAASFAGGTGSFQVSPATGSCSAWTSGTTIPWLSITSGANSTGSGTVGYSVAAGSELRGSITSAGKTFDLLRTGSGGLDSGFNYQSGSGFGYAALSTALGSGSQFTINASLLQADGKIVVTGYVLPGNLFVARLNQDGSKDTGFGTSGLYVYTNPNGISTGTGIALDSSSRIIVAGYQDNAGISLSRKGTEFMVLRLSGGGALDGGFGTSGIASFSAGPTTGDNLFTDMATAVALDNANNIVVAGSTQFSVGYVVQYQTALLVRFTDVGALDTTFNAGASGGFATYSSGSSTTEFYNALAILADNSIVAAGATKSAVYSNILLTKTSSSGSLITTGFGGGGVVTYHHAVASNDSASAIKIQPDGSIIVAGTATNTVFPYNDDAVLLRYQSTGVLDAAGFNGSGAIPGAASYANASAKSVSLQSDGKIIVAGSKFISSPDMLVLRYNTNGTIDTSFGVAGAVTFDGPKESNDFATTVQIGAADTIVVAGYGSYFVGLTSYQEGYLFKLTQASAVIAISPTSPITFVDTPVGGNSSTTLTISNNGSSLLDIFSINKSGSADFTLVSGDGTGGTCGSTYPKKLAASASCTVGVTFAPTALGSVNAALAISSNDPLNAMATVALSATGVLGTCNWTDPVNGGNWNDITKWDCGRAPGVNDNAVITLSGTYTVIMDVAATINGLILGGASGVQTLTATSKTLTINSLSSLGVNGIISLTGSTINGTGSLTNNGTLTLNGSTLGTSVTNAGTILVNGSSPTVSFYSSTLSYINGALATQAGSMLRVDGAGYHATLTVASGFTNNGTIELTTSSGVAYDANLKITSGILTNSAATGVINSLTGVGGNRILTGQLDNQGTVSISAPTTITGTSLTNSGTITINPGYTLTVSGGTFTNTLASGITGTGTLTLTSESLTAATLTTLPKLTNSTVTLLDSYTMSTALSLTGTTISGAAGSITVPTGQTLTLSGSTLGTPVTNAGTILVTSIGNSIINGTLTTQAGSMLRVDAVGFNTMLTVASGFTNNGTIELTSSSGGNYAYLIITSGTLTNSGVINTLTGLGGSRILNGLIDNQGALSISAMTNITSTSFTNSGTITINSGWNLTITGSTFTNNLASGITINGNGALQLTGQSLTAATLNTLSKLFYSTVTLLDSYVMSNALTLVGTTISGASGSITVPSGQILTMSGSTLAATIPVSNAGTILETGILNTASKINGPLTTQTGSMLRIDAVAYPGILTVANGFTNNGTIELTSSNNFNASLNITSGALINSATTGVINFLAGIGSSRNLTGILDNQGTLSISAATTITGTSLTNSGTITINPGYTLTVSGGTFTNSSIGTLNGAGTLDVSGATFSNAGNITPATAGTTSTLSITGLLPETATSAANIDIASPTLYDQIAVSGAATISGTLNVGLIGGYFPVINDSFTIMTCGSGCNSGVFTNAPPFFIGSGRKWSIAYTSTSIILSVVAGVTISTAVLPDAVTTTLYSQTLTAAGGAAPYTWSVIAGTLPGGLSLTGDTISGTPTASGIYNFTVKATDSLGYGEKTYSMVVAKANATITWPTASAIIYGQTLAASTLIGGTATPAGTFAFTTPATAPVAGTAAQSITFTPTDTANYNSATNTASVTVNQATPVITWAAPAAITYGTALSATELNATASVPGTFVYAPASGIVLTAGTQTVSVTFTPTDTTNYTAATKTVSLVVNQATPVITWAAPAAITYGTALSVTQLNATASVPGTFVYAPASGIVLTAGTQTVSVTFTPTDTTNYTAATKTVSLVVNQATPVITWAAPAAITYGTALSVTQLNATASAPGTLAYTPASGIVLSAGTQTLSVTFTPTDTTNYTTATKTVSLVVNKSTPTITWPTPTAVPVGTTLSSTQLNASSASVPGTFSYTPTLGTVMNTVSSQTLSVSFTPTDTANYTSPVSATVSLLVTNKIIPVITWPVPTALTYGTALSATQLNATASVAGTFAYTPAAAAILTAGTQTLSVTFTPTDTVTYSSANGTVNILVNKATATITWPIASTITYSQTLASSTLSGGASTPAGTFAFTTPTTAPNAGTVLQSVTFTPTDTINYNSTNGTASVTVNQTTPVITWAAPTAITYGMALSVTELNATASVPGTLAYTPASGTVLPAGTQTVSVTFTPTDTTNYTTAIKTVTLLVNQTTPVITWAAPTAITYGMALSVTELNATASVPGTLAYTPASGTVLSAGTQTVSVTFTPTDTINYTTAIKTVTLLVNQTTPVITWAAPTAITYGTALSATQLNATASVPGTLAYTPASGAVLSVGTQTVSVTFTPTDTTNYTTATKTVTLLVNQATPIITWAAPTAITYGTALSATQLNATASVAGTFAYTPAAGTILTAGTQTLSVAFTPTDTVTYSSATSTVNVVVNQTTPVITWAAPSAIAYGTALSVTELNATASVPGTFVYTPASGTVLPAGTQTLSVTFTPTDTTNYTTATKTVTLIVNKSTPTITWPTPTAVPVGTTLSSTQLNATSASVPGTFSYTPTLGTVMNTVGNQTLSVSFSATDTANYTSPVSATVSLVVTSKIIPVITWAAPTAITYGTALSATQLNATASVAGTFAYTPAAGTILTAGTQTLSVAFTPTDTVTYSSATSTVNVVVNQTTPVITWAAPSAIAYGTALSVTELNATASVPGTFVYSPASGIVLPAGTQTLSVTFTPTDTTNYTTATKTVTLIVNKSTPTITWPTPTAVPVGTTLSSTQLNASSASVPGTFSYIPTLGTVMNTVGNQTLSVSFSATDAANYTSPVSATVSLVVTSKIIPVITWAAPTAITYGTALSATQLNATASVAGTFAYTPAAGTILTAGTQTLSVAFTPTDITNYTHQTASVTLTVTPLPANQITTGPDGKTTVPVTITTSGATVTLAAGTLLLDADGKPISGMLTITTSVMNTIAGLPIGLAGAPTSGGLILTSLGNSIDITISAGLSHVKTINPPMMVALTIPSTFALPGKTVSYYSFNGTVWISEGSTIVKADGTAEMQVGHLSVWAIADFVSPVDSIAPEVYNFTLPTLSATLSVTGITLTATDVTGVTGYLLSQNAAPPSPSASEWTANVPTMFTFRTWGHQTLYAFAKDAVGNISTARSASLQIGPAGADGVIIPIASGTQPIFEPQLADALKSLNFAMKIEIPTAAELLHGDVAPLINGVPNPNGVINLGDTVVILRRVVGL